MNIHVNIFRNLEGARSLKQCDRVGNEFDAAAALPTSLGGDPSPRAPLPPRARASDDGMMCLTRVPVMGRTYAW